MLHGPVVRRRKLGEELRSLRHTSGLTSRDAARLLGWHQSKVSRIETGASGVTPADVSRLLDVYAVRDTQLRSLLEVLAGSAGGGGSGWWHAYRGLIPPQYRDFISLESQASTVRTLETSVVPGLLQTAGYARAVTRASLDGLPDGRLDSLVEVRLTRQRVLRESAAALHRRAGRGGAPPRGGRTGGDEGSVAASATGGPTPSCATAVAAVLGRRLRRTHLPFRYLLLSEHF